MSTQRGTEWLFTWEAVSGAVQYQVWIGTRRENQPLINTFTPTPTKQGDLGNSFSYTSQGPVTETDLVWQVRAVYGPRRYGPWSETRAFTLRNDPPAPAGQGNAAPAPKAPATPEDYARQFLDDYEKSGFSQANRAKYPGLSDQQDYVPTQIRGSVIRGLKKNPKNGAWYFEIQADVISGQRIRPVRTIDLVIDTNNRIRWFTERVGLR